MKVHSVVLVPSMHYMATWTFFDYRQLAFPREFRVRQGPLLLLLLELPYRYSIRNRRFSVLRMSLHPTRKFIFGAV